MATILQRNSRQKPKKKTYAEHAEDALYREVWEEVNNEKTQRFIKKYARAFMIAAIAILIVVTGVQIGMRTWHASKIATAINYETAVANLDANALAAVAGDAHGATADLALFQSYMLDGDVAKIERLAERGKSRDFRDLARLHVVGLRGDEMTAADVEKYLAPLDTKKSPFYYTACLTVAQAYMAENNFDAANVWLDKIINDADAPVVVSASAQTLRRK